RLLGRAQRRRNLPIAMDRRATRNRKRATAHAVAGHAAPARVAIQLFRAGNERRASHAHGAWHSAKSLAGPAVDRSVSAIRLVLSFVDANRPALPRNGRRPELYRRVGIGGDHSPHAEFDFAVRAISRRHAGTSRRPPRRLTFGAATVRERA